MSGVKEENADGVVGITVVTGFLGSGKTTLVNHILTSNHGYKIAVIQQIRDGFRHRKMLVTTTHDEEDGEETPEKKKKKKNAVVEEWVELDNGCVCCTVKGSLIQTIEKLMEKKKKKKKGDDDDDDDDDEINERSAFDYILLETTGLANPGPICGELWVDDALLEDSENAAVLRFGGVRRGRRNTSKRS